MSGAAPHQEGAAAGTQPSHANSLAAQISLYHALTGAAAGGGGGPSAAQSSDAAAQPCGGVTRLLDLPEAFKLSHAPSPLPAPQASSSRRASDAQQPLQQWATGAALGQQAVWATRSEMSTASSLQLSAGCGSYVTVPSSSTVGDPAAEGSDAVATVSARPGVTAQTLQFQQQAGRMPHAEVLYAQLLGLQGQQQQLHAHPHPQHQLQVLPPGAAINAYTADLAYGGAGGGVRHMSAGNSQALHALSSQMSGLAMQHQASSPMSQTPPGTEQLIDTQGSDTLARALANASAALTAGGASSAAGPSAGALTGRASGGPHSGEPGGSASAVPGTSTVIGGIDLSAATVNSASLYVKNLPPDSERDAELFLYQRFAPHGALLSCKVKTDPATGKCRGVGFVNFNNRESALNALKHLQGSRTPEGRQLHITVQAPRAVRAAAAAAAAASVGGGSVTGVHQGQLGLDLGSPAALPPAAVPPGMRLQLVGQPADLGAMLQQHQAQLAASSTTTVVPMTLPYGTTLITSHAHGGLPLLAQLQPATLHPLPAPPRQQ